MMIRNFMDVLRLVATLWWTRAKNKRTRRKTDKLIMENEQLLEEMRKWNSHTRQRIVRSSEERDG